MNSQTTRFLSRYRYVIIAVIILLLVVTILPLALFHQKRSAADSSLPFYHQPMAFDVLFDAKTPADVDKAAQIGIKYGIYDSPSIQPAGKQFKSDGLKAVPNTFEILGYSKHCQELPSIQDELLKDMCTGMKPMADNVAYDLGFADGLTLANFNAVSEAYLTSIKNDPDKKSVVGGFWILDDWIESDAGGMKETLIQIHQLIAASGLNLPTMCGFGVFLSELNQAAVFPFPWEMKNLSKEGCDVITPYIYGLISTPSGEPAGQVIGSGQNLDWSMGTLLPEIFRALQDQMPGWDPKVNAWVGIGQSFYAHNGSDYEYPKPTAEEMKTQALGFAQAGATSVGYFIWQTTSLIGPATDNDLLASITGSIAAVNEYWQKSEVKPAPEPIPVASSSPPVAPSSPINSSSPTPKPPPPAIKPLSPVKIIQPTPPPKPVVVPKKTKTTAKPSPSTVPVVPGIKLLRIISGADNLDVASTNKAELTACESLRLEGSAPAGTVIQIKLNGVQLQRLSTGSTGTWNDSIDGGVIGVGDQTLDILDNQGNLKQSLAVTVNPCPTPSFLETIRQVFSNLAGSLHF